MIDGPGRTANRIDPAGDADVDRAARDVLAGSARTSSIPGATAWDLRLSATTRASMVVS